MVTIPALYVLFSLILLEGGENEIKTDVYKLFGTVASRARKADEQHNKRKS